jgi:lipopolysaccharide/colanic/teichoic acid biosynthesis glycosyltransferase
MRWEKRAFDFIFSTLGLVFLFPFFFIIALLIKIEDGGPVLFIQKRIGYRGRPFFMYKFRTMVVDADKKGNLLTVGGDPRITKSGRLLRKFKLDELPQLINVLKGEMSLVGPRPEVEKYVNLYTNEQREVLNLYPGITDPASIKYVDENEVLEKAEDPERVYIEKIMPEKIRLNLEYAKNATVITDFMVIIKTLFEIIK